MTPHQINRRVIESPARLEAYDRRLAAIHEAGHAIMAAHLGYGAEAWIHRNKTDDAQGEKTWVGRMTMHGLPDNRDHPDTRMVAVAGLVAETLWKNGHDEDHASPDGWEDHLMDGDSMSESDWRMTNCVPGEADGDLHDIAANVARLFMNELWPELTNAARMLMGGPDATHAFKLTRQA